MHTNPYTHENARQGALHYLMGRGAAGLAGFLTVLLLVRFMDLHNYAAYTALSGLVALCGVLAGLGMERIISRYVPEGRLYRTVEELEHFIWFTSLIRLIAAILIISLLWGFWPAVNKFLVVTESNFISKALACFIVAEVMFQHFSSILQSLVMQKALTRLMVIQWAGRLLLITIFILLKSTISWNEALWIFAIPEMLGVIGFTVVIKLHLRALSVPTASEPINDKWPEWHKVTKIGLHNYGFTLLAAPPQGYFMKLLTAAYLPVEIVAAYGFFLSVAEKARQYIPLNFFYGLIEPMMIASYLKDHDFSALSYRCQLLYKSNLLLMVPAIVWIAVAGNSIVDVLTGGKFHGLSWILVLVMVQLTLGSHVPLLQLILNSLGKSKLLLKAGMIGLPIMILAIIVSVFTNPIWLLFSPFLFSLFINSYIVFQLGYGDHPYKPSWKMLGGVLLAGLVAFVTVKSLAIATSWTSTSFIMALSMLFGVMIIYGLVIWGLKAINKFEIELVKSLIFNIQRTKGGT